MGRLMRAGVLLVALVACPKPAAKPAPIPKFDVHLHIGPDGMPRTLEIFRANGITGGVNLSGGNTPQILAHQLRSAEAAHGRMLVFANLDFQHVFEPGWVEGQVAWLAQAKQMGARGLKIFKALGLQIHDSTGARVAVDDPRLDPIFDAAGKLGFPVAIHVGDPKAFFEPTTPANERYDELALNPNWSWADRTRFPTWEALHTEFEHRLARSPNTTFIGVHFGNDPEDPAQVAAMLDAHPNLYIDTAARVPEIGRYPADKLRAIFLAHQQRRTSPWAAPRGIRRRRRPPPSSSRRTGGSSRPPTRGSSIRRRSRATGRSTGSISRAKRWRICTIGTPSGCSG